MLCMKELCVKDLRVKTLCDRSGLGGGTAADGGRDCTREK